MDIKPIETEYKGYKFRSRLEARWAVFFDSIDANWKYESEGYEIEGIRYLPDFEITNDHTKFFIEIKPNVPNEIELKKAKLLAKHTKKFVLIASSDPYDAFTNLEDTRLVLSDGKTTRIDKNTLFMIVGALNPDIFIKLAEIESKCNDASKKARQARFEFGETPQ